LHIYISRKTAGIYLFSILVVRKFIKNIILFIVTFTIILGIFEFISTKLFQVFSDFNIKTQPKHLVLGHSQSECAYNDSLLTSFYNLSSSGESYFYNYYKAKIILEQNPQIETVFIEFSNNQIIEKMNQWIWGERYISNKYPKYAPFIDNRGKILLMSKNISGFINSSSISAKIKINRIIKGDYNFLKTWGGYQFLIRDKTDSIVNVLANKSTSKKILTDSNNTSQYNIYYLRMLVDLCYDYKKTVFLIRSPLHEMYPGYKNEIEYQAILNHRFADVEYVDFSKFPLSNAEFGDLQHLNHKGAKGYSIWFQSLLNKGLLNQENKQDFIDNEINLIKDKLDS